jgi:uncharacterized protein YsxB (DUF464 family)
MLRTDRDTKQTSPEHDLVCSALTVLIQLTRLLLYGDEVEILRRNYKNTWSSNFEFPQKYITHQIAIYLAHGHAILQDRGRGGGTWPACK